MSENSAAQPDPQLPPDGEVERVHAAAVAIAREAGETLMGYYQRPLDVRFKSKEDTDPVTEADEQIEALVRRSVNARFPDHGVLGEETADTRAASAFVWVVDPLDGTANFANGLTIFAVSIGVLWYGVPIVGALFTTFGPEARPCVVHARRGGPVFVDDKPSTGPVRNLSRRARLSGVPAGFHYRFRFRRPRRSPPGETRSLGSIAVELGLVATGGLQYALFSGPRIWDVAGGVVLVQAAGGAVYAFTHNRWALLQRFEPPAGRALREWRRTLMAGDAELVASLATRAHVHRTPVEWLERFLGEYRAAQIMMVVRLSRRVVWNARRIARRARQVFHG